MAIPIKPVAQFLEELAVRTIPELGERGTAAAPEILKRVRPPATVGLRSPGTPFKGTPAAKQVARTTRVEAPRIVRIADAVDRYRDFLTGFFRSEPGLPRDLGGKFYNTRVRVNAAQENVDILLRDQVFSHLQRDPANQVDLLADYVILADEFSSLSERAAKLGLPPTKVRGRAGVSLKQIETSLRQVQAAASADPEVMMAHRALRKQLDDTFDDMVAQGYISPKRRRADYTPIQMLTEIAEGLASNGSPSGVTTGVLDAMMARTGSRGPRETNIIEVMRVHLGEYARKRAEDDLVVELMDDATINFTGKFRKGDEVPRGLAIYAPGPGMPGYGRKSIPGNFMAGFQQGMAPTSRTYMGGFVVPEKIAAKLNAFKPRGTTGGENAIYRAGQAWARQMTVYSPRNTTLNMLSDTPLALLGEAGEPSRAIGVLRMFPKAMSEVRKGLFGKGSPYYDMLRKEGGASATLAFDVGGAPVSTDFSRFYPKGKLSPLQKVQQAFKGTRQFVEAIPRMAAGMEALERTGDPAQFGRVARNITLPYGAGAPANVRHPVMRAMAPFFQFMGLATDRVFQMMATPGSRARISAGLMAVPTATMQWNYQNDAYRQVENSLPSYEQDQMHIIVPDPSDPSKPALDKNGKPIVMRVRYWVPEEVMNFLGLGNLPSRARKVLEGRATPMEFAGSIPGNLARNVAGQLGPVTVALEAALQRSLVTGQPKPISETLRSMLPLQRIALETARGAEQGGAGEAAKRMAEETLGASFATPERKGRAILDAELRDAKRDLDEAIAAVRRFSVRGDKSRAREAIERRDRARDRLARIAEAIQKERE